ncbi:MAG: tripartite tricarboxylate transporter substrate binding protein [Betaproteobacteria bacterium]|nr:tripartite tricarboxylate transporter substrate binding protein [Betaproteobacteria bacterium]
MNVLPIAVLALSALSLVPHPAAAQSAYPNKPIKIVVAYPPGASADMIARAVGQKLSDSMGQPVVVENRGGAGGTIGTDFVAKSAPDGYTLTIGTDATHCTNYYVFKGLPYHPLNDFTPITAAVQNIIALVVNPAVPANSVKELVEYGKRNPGKLAYGTPGNGSPHHLSGALLGMLTGVELTHVPYKGGGPALTDLLGGQIPMVFSSLSAVAQHIRSGKVRILGMVETNRYAPLPDVPTVGESIPGFEMSSWLGFFGPAGLPQPIVARLNAEMVRALNAADVRARFEPAGLAVIGGSAEQFGTLQKNSFEQRGKLVKAAGIQAE